MNIKFDLGGLLVWVKAQEVKAQGGDQDVVGQGTRSQGVDWRLRYK